MYDEKVPVHIPISTIIMVSRERPRITAIAEICSFDKYACNLNVIVLRLQLYRNLFGNTAGVAYATV